MAHDNATPSINIKDAIRIARAYMAGTPASARLYAYWEQVNAALALMGESEAIFSDVVRMYEDECSVDQAAYEIADPAFGYDAYLSARAAARQAAYSDGAQ